MARVTVDDCLGYIPNRFELVLIATKRARQLIAGSVQPCVPWGNDKSTVIALREIAQGSVGRDLLEEIHVPDPRPVMHGTNPAHMVIEADDLELPHE